MAYELQRLRHFQIMVHLANVTYFLFSAIPTSKTMFLSGEGRTEHFDILVHLISGLIVILEEL